MRWDFMEVFNCCYNFIFGILCNSASRVCCKGIIFTADALYFTISLEIPSFRGIDCYLATYDGVVTGKCIEW